MLVCQKADGEAASAKLNTLTHAYYVGILKAYVPAIYHGQDLGRGDRCGLRLKAHVRKVTNVTPRRKSTTQFGVRVRTSVRRRTHSSLVSTLLTKSCLIWK